MENMTADVAKVSMHVIDLSSDDEDTVEEKQSSGMLYLSRLAVKQESSQSSKSQETLSLENKHAVQSQTLSRSISHISESNLHDPEHDIDLKFTQQDGIVPNDPNETHVQSQINEGNFGHSNGKGLAENSVFFSLSDKDQPSAHVTQNSKDLDDSALQGNCHLSDPQSCHSKQKFQQIQNKMDMGCTNQGSKLNSQNVPKVGVVPPILASTLNCSGINLKKNSFNQFWKAGDYDVQNPQKRSLPGGMYHVRVHPKFLHSNATSHKWAFGAIAELLDNAVDEIQNGATFVIVDKIENPRDNSPALLFQDNGGGMDPDCMRQCMSLGYSVKTNSTTIGQYGNGFKTSTMRLGADVIVFSRSGRGSPPTQSIGLLSYTFLRRTGQDDTIVPMVDFVLSQDLRKATMLIRSTKDDWLKNLTTILQWSPYKTEDELMNQFEDIGPHGTKIVIYNLWLNDDGVLELDFDKDKEDIRLREVGKIEKPMPSQKALLQSSISYRLRYSLRVYASILYLKKLPNFSIILRGNRVEHHYIADDLKFPKVVIYKPQLGIVSKEVSVATTIGFAPEAPSINIQGFNVYHKNRLIMPFWKIWPSNTDSRGRGVVGVLEANFIEPAHDKQDFERTSILLRLEARLKQMTADYWRLHCGLIGYQAKSSTDGQRNSLPSTVVEKPYSASVVPRCSISQNIVSHNLAASKSLPNHGQIAGPVLADLGVHNQQLRQETSRDHCGKLNVPNLGVTLESKELLSVQSHAITSPILVEEKPDLTLLSAMAASRFTAQPSKMSLDKVVSVSNGNPLLDPGLDILRKGDEEKRGNFGQELDNPSNADDNCSSLDTSKRKASSVMLCNSEDLKRHRNCEGILMSGTLHEQIADVWNQLKRSRCTGNKYSQATVFLPGKFVEKVTDHNIQLFMRCEQHRHNETQLHQVIARLENELMMAKRKFAQLRSSVELQNKKQAKSLGMD